MTALRAGIQRALLTVYETANRRGWLDSRVAEVVFQRGYFAYKRLVEDPFAKLAAARPELFRGGEVIDVGANIGYTACLFARALDAPHRVHAFEPEERNFRWLEHAISRAGLTGRVDAHRAAVGAREGTIELWHNVSHHGDHRIATDALRALRDEPTQRVPLTSVDVFVAGIGAPPIAFIKIDVQGYEPEVLRGMRETLAANPRVHVAVEMMPSALEELGFPADDFLRELADALPQLAILERDGRLRDADIASITRACHDSGLGYVDLVCASKRS
jgi:FkbM family methyltransferase